MIAGVTPEPRQPAPTAPAPEAEVEVVPAPEGLTELVGFDVAPIDDARRTEFDIAAGASGIVVTMVRGGSDAAAKGVHPGPDRHRGEPAPDQLRWTS